MYLVQMYEFHHWHEMITPASFCSPPPASSGFSGHALLNKTCMLTLILLDFMKMYQKLVRTCFDTVVWDCLFSLVLSLHKKTTVHFHHSVHHVHQYYFPGKFWLETSQLLMLMLLHNTNRFSFSFWINCIHHVNMCIGRRKGSTRENGLYKLRGWHLITIVYLQSVNTVCSYVRIYCSLCIDNTSLVQDREQNGQITRKAKEGLKIS